jgi:hypothetical protein
MDRQRTSTMDNIINTLKETDALLGHAIDQLAVMKEELKAVN